MPEEPDDKSIHLKYILNFLATTGFQKWNQWIPTSVSTDAIAATKKSKKSFPDYLASQMDHTVSQRCRIHNWKMCVSSPGETPDELVDHVRALADRCNFPTDDEKEHLVSALTDSELVKKLLALDIKRHNSQDTWTHIAIADNLHAMGLRFKTVNAVNKCSQ